MDFSRFIALASALSSADPARPNPGIVAFTMLPRVTRRALADTHYNIGVRHARRQRWSEAVASYETAIGFDRGSAEAFNGAGIALRRLHHDQAAVAMFDEALRLRPSFADARYNLAGALAALGRYAEAIESCRTALELRPKLREAIQLLDSLQRTLMPDSRRAGA